MKCERFAAWLENRDTHDVSEADRAYRHAAECDNCDHLLKKDEVLDAFITQKLAAEPVPDRLKNRIELNLERSVPGRSGKGLLAALSMACIIVVALFAFNPLQQQFATMDELGTFMLADHLDHAQQATLFEPVADPTVWLAAHIESNNTPPRQLTAGYTVKGARFCHLGHCQAVHMVYEKNGELVSVFVVDEGEIDFHLEQGRVYTLAMDGKSVKLCKQNNHVYALVI